MEQSETSRQTPAPLRDPAQRWEGAGHSDARKKQIYLRTVYPLNPGIPHFVDVPGGW
jgi:hypothetical protein